jgi:Ca2+-transporting ATPase
LFKVRTIVAAVLQGLVALAMVFVAQRLGYLIGGWEGKDQQGVEDESRTLAFASLILTNISLVFVNRSWNRPIFRSLRTLNRSLLWVTGGTLTFLLLAIYVPFLQKLFHFTALHFYDLAIAAGLSVCSIFGFEVVKWMLLRERKER